MTDHAELLPCPFCGVTLKETPDLANKTTRVFLHPRSDGFLCLSEDVVIWENNKDRITAWNTRAAPVLPDRGWRDIADHDKSRAPVLLVGRYRDGVTWSDIYHGWWQPEFESADENGDNGVMMPGSWARWPHPFPPTHFQILALPEAPAEGAE